MIAIFRYNNSDNEIRRIVDFEIKDEELKNAIVKLKGRGTTMYSRTPTILEFFDGTVDQYNNE